VRPNVRPPSTSRSKKECAWLPVELPSALSDEQGRFVLEHVPAGAWVVATADASVEVTAASGASVEIELREAAPPANAPGSEHSAIG